MKLSGVEKKRSNLRQDLETFICRSFVLFIHMCIDTLRFGAALCLKLMNW